MREGVQGRHEPPDTQNHLQAPQNRLRVSRYDSKPPLFCLHAGRRMEEARRHSERQGVFYSGLGDNFAYGRSGDYFATLMAVLHQLHH